jgi:hypothetical protein
VTGGKPISVLLQSISGVNVINPLVAFYDIHGGKKDVLFFHFVPLEIRTLGDRLCILIIYFISVNITLAITSSINDKRALYTQQHDYHR